VPRGLDQKHIGTLTGGGYGSCDSAGRGRVDDDLGVGVGVGVGRTGRGREAEQTQHCEEEAVHDRRLWDAETF
jgi:hypothetical protein